MCQQDKAAEERIDFWGSRQREARRELPLFYPGNHKNIFFSILWQSCTTIVRDSDHY
jgi:hypothetical protein